MIEIFSTLRFSVKHGGSVSVTARQQPYCASNLEQGGGKVPAAIVLRKASHRTIQGTAGETLGRPSR